MKKVLSIVLVLAMLFGLCALAGCGKKDAAEKTIKIGASPTPHAEILNVAKAALEKEGYTLEIIEYNDYVLPNTATESGELDANYFQHTPYLDDFNKENGTHLASVAKVHYEPFGVYAGKVSSLDEITDGSQVAIPNDGSNEARALYLLQDNGFIKLKDDIGFTATILDIEEYYVNIDIVEMEAAQLVRSLADVDIAIINGNYALGGGLDVNDALAVENSDSDAAQTYANILVVKEGNENAEKIQALVKAVLSAEVKDYINNTYGGAVVPIF